MLATDWHLHALGGLAMDAQPFRRLRGGGYVLDDAMDLADASPVRAAPRGIPALSAGRLSGALRSRTASSVLAHGRGGRAMLDGPGVRGACRARTAGSIGDAPTGQDVEPALGPAPGSRRRDVVDRSGTPVLQICRRFREQPGDPRSDTLVRRQPANRRGESLA